MSESDHSTSTPAATPACPAMRLPWLKCGSSGVKLNTQALATGMPGTFGEMQTKLVDIVNKLDKVSIEQISRHVPTANRVADSNLSLQQGMRSMMQELTRAAATVRAFTDYLEHHPEALILGSTDTEDKDHHD